MHTSQPDIYSQIQCFLHARAWSSGEMHGGEHARSACYAFRLKRFGAPGRCKSATSTSTEKPSLFNYSFPLHSPGNRKVFRRCFNCCRCLTQEVRGRGIYCQMGGRMALVVTASTTAPARVAMYCLSSLVPFLQELLIPLVQGIDGWWVAAI